MTSLEIQNRKTIHLDLKKGSDSTVGLQFIQLDSNAIQFAIEENNITADLSQAGRIVANYKRPDGTVISRILTTNRNIATYTIGAEEMEQEGTGELELQFYSADNTKRLTTKRFRVQFVSPIGSEEISESDPQYTVLQALFVELDTALTSAETATIDANAATVSALESASTANIAAGNADEKATLAQQKVESLSLLESDLNTLKTATEVAKTNAETATSMANTAAGDANTATGNANLAAETANTAAISANTAAVLANDAADTAQDIADNTHFEGEFSVTTVYQANNFVRYSGSTFISLVDDNVGNTPDPMQDTDYWAITAMRGVDGTGAVSKVNNVSPDANGNITLSAGALGALETSQRGTAGGVAGLNVSGKVIDAAGNIVESFSKDYNELNNKPVIPSKTSELTNDSNLVNSTILSNHTGDSVAHLSSTEHTKLTNIQAGAEVNQNAFSQIKVGSQTIPADTKQDIIELVAGTNITISSDITGRITISANGNSIEEVYVDNTVGNDETGDGTKSNPYKTIDKALETIGKAHSTDITIYINPGTYDAPSYANLSHHVGVSITFHVKERLTDIAGTANIQGTMDFFNNHCNFNLKYINVKASPYNPGVRFSDHTGIVNLQEVDVLTVHDPYGIGSVFDGFEISGAAVMSLDYCSISNTRYGIIARKGATIVEYNTTGESNETVYWANGGIILNAPSDFIAGTTMLLKNGGGQIFS